jgi:hypothetical protein
MGQVTTRSALLLLLFLSACGPSEAEAPRSQRISLDEARGQPAEPMASPDTKNASWQVNPDGQAISYGDEGAKPFLTLACRARANPPAVRIIRHAPARPGEKALFPVLAGGNYRFNLDAALEGGEWRWQGDLPASDPLMDAFTSRGPIEATLPGAGTLLIGASRIPGEFVEWCRAGGGTGRAEAAENAQQAEEAASSPAPAR